MEASNILTLEVRNLCAKDGFEYCYIGRKTGIILVLLSFHIRLVHHEWNFLALNITVAVLQVSARARYQVDAEQSLCSLA